MARITHRALRAAFPRRAHGSLDNPPCLAGQQAGSGYFRRAGNMAGRAIRLSAHTVAAGCIAEVRQIAPGQNKGIKCRGVRTLHAMGRARNHQGCDKHRQ